MSGRNQADPSLTGTSTGKRSRSEYSDPDYNKDASHLPDRMESETLGLVEYREKLKSFCNDDRPIGDFDKLEAEHKSSLRSFSGTLEKCLKHASIFNDKPQEQTYKGALCALESILRSTAKESSHDDLLIPGPLAKEEQFTQPYLLVVLQVLGSAVDEVGIPGKSPGKTNVQKKPIYPKMESRRERVADKLIAANSPFIFLLRDDSVEIPVEEKSGERSGRKPVEMLCECTDQDLSHLAKQVGIAFNFAGIGIDARATGVILTPAYVKIVQLRLEKLETKCMPLLSKTSFDKWVHGREREWASIKLKLYGDDRTQANENSSNAEVPSGPVALWNLMTTSRSDLVGLSPLGLGALGELIGFGAFAMVHNASENTEHVIKLLGYGAKVALDRESSVLRALQGQRAEPVLGISQLVASKELSFAIGGINVQLPALTLAPCGISVEMHLAQYDGDGKKECLLEIGRDLVSALRFVHEQGYSHNDVSPKNILFDQTKGNAFLIDFGSASSHLDKIKGFHGTPRYAHRAIFRMYPGRKWSPKPEYDNSSLAFSMAVLPNQGKYLWKSFQPCNISGKENEERKKELNSWSAKRSSIAWCRLKQIGFTSDWESWCSDIGDCN